MAAAPPSHPLLILVVDGDSSHDWTELFNDVMIAERSVHVVQCAWIDIMAVVSSDPSFGRLLDHDVEGLVSMRRMSPRCSLTIAPIRESSGKVVAPKTITVTPDFVLIRNSPRGFTDSADWRPAFFGMMMAQLPSINSFHSLYMCLERCLMFGELNRLADLHGHDQFPIIPQTYFSTYHMMRKHPALPAIVKVSHAHAGMGKIQVSTPQQFHDVATVVAVGSHKYCTIEPFIKAEFGIRIQRIGKHIRAYHRRESGSAWQSQFGGCVMDGSVEVTPQYQRWADIAATAFGGMDIFALDAICSTDGRYFLLELNDSAIGIPQVHWRDDSRDVVELVVERVAGLVEAGIISSSSNGEADEDEDAMTLHEEAYLELQAELLRG